MNKNNLKLVIQATSCNRGAIGVFHIHSSEEELSRIVDRQIGNNNKGNHFKSLTEGELKYGIFLADDSSELDEVLVAKPGSGQRVIMCHGGRYITQAIGQYFARNGFTEITAGALVASGAGLAGRDTAVLAQCLTQTQVSQVLERLEHRSEDAAEDALSADVFAVRHVCLVGPPNAGKSSLLNRVSGFDRVFVHSEAGATRDVVGEYVELAGYAVLLDDFPGFSKSLSAMQHIWNKAIKRLSLASVVVFVCDGSREWDETTEQAAVAVAKAIQPERHGRQVAAPPVLVVLNKSDLPYRITGRPWERHFPSAATLAVCALEGGDADAKFAEEVADIFGRLHAKP